MDLLLESLAVILFLALATALVALVIGALSRDRSSLTPLQARTLAAPHIAARLAIRTRRN